MTGDADIELAAVHAPTQYTRRIDVARAATHGNA
jgi:hypothetical protein